MSELGDLLELLYGAGGRWRTVRLTLRDWSHLERTREAWERFHEQTKRGGGHTLRVGAYVPGPSRPRPETSEHLTRFWLEGDRSRHESGRDGKATVVVHDGDTWWMTSPNGERTTNAGDSTQRAGGREDVVSLLDPAALLGSLYLEPRGSVEVAGRPGIAVHAVPRKGDLFSPGLWYLHCEEVELVVDAERGIVMRTTEFIDGEPYHVREILQIAFDETFPDDTFRIELPHGQECAGGHEAVARGADAGAGCCPRLLQAVRPGEAR